MAVKTKEEKNPSSFFDIMNICLKKLSIPSDDLIQKHCNQWMLCNYLSCCQEFAPLAAELSTLKLTNKEFFDILYYGLPKTNMFIKYNATKAKADARVKNVCNHYGVSPEISKQYIKIMCEDELIKIDDLYAEKGLRKRNESH